MVDKNLKLYLPFDDPDGNKAYDYSPSRADATLSDGAAFTKTAKTGKALALNGGECATAQAVPFSGNFTLSAYIMTAQKRIGWVVNLVGVENYREEWVEVVPNQWYFIAFVRDGDVLSVWLDAQRVASYSLGGTPQGLSLCTDELLTTTAIIDEVKVYNVAKTEKDILEAQADNDVEYYIDGINFKDYGVFVSASNGLVGRLAQKDPLSVDWDNYHGIVRDRNRKRYKERTITLDCFLEASGRSAFVEWTNRFMSLFDGNGTHRLTVKYGKEKPLVYEVALYDEVEVSKTWGSYNNDLMVGTFKLKLVEDEPVKRVLRHVSANDNSKASFTVTSSKLLNVYWGDGTNTFNVTGNDTTVEHTFALAGEYDIIISGVIEDIEKFETNEIVLWELLK